MTQYLKSLTSYLPSLPNVPNWLPKNAHTKKAAELTNEIQSLEQGLTDKTGTVFQAKISETKQSIAEEKQKCIKTLSRINGDYYQDPNSALKKSWDRLVNSVKNALNIDIEGLNQVPQISAQLETVIETEATKKAKTQIKCYKQVEEHRNNRQAQLERIIATEKASSPDGQEQLKLKKESLQQELRALCGDYFGDPKGQLDKAWRKHQTAINHGSTGEHSLAAYQALEAQRKKIKAELYTLDQQLSIPASPERTFEKLTVISVTKQIQELKEVQTKETELSGVDWKGISVTAAKTALIATGYLLLV